MSPPVRTTCPAPIWGSGSSPPSALQCAGGLLGKRVDAFFRALGQLSAVRVLERFQEDPGRLIQHVEKELIQSDELDGAAT